MRTPLYHWLCGRGPWHWSECIVGLTKMVEPPQWVQIGSSFVTHYYQTDASCLTWEGEQFQGKMEIVRKLTSLPFTKIAHIVTAQDHQPTPDSCIISMVVGQLKADDDLIMGFQQTFMLKSVNESWGQP
uniref:Nuclear transport factor 2 n=1 Tax=Knipowitschia caucasica TaxID=637954 RepID=A0AAV2KZ48_KNICA